MSLVAVTERLEDRTPEEWRELLLARLKIRADEAAVFEAYYDGVHPLQFATSKYREAFGYLFHAFADNWCQLIVDAAVERLKIIGFEVGGSASAKAWEIWQANALDVESVVCHTEVGKCGRAYLLVDPNEGSDDGPRITVEHMAQVVVAVDPGDRRHRLAAVKRWLGADNFQYATLYLPDLVMKFESDAPIPAGPLNETTWVPRQGVEFETPNPLGVVPVIPIEKKPGLLGSAHSDLEPAIPLQNAVNKLCSDMIVTSEYGAFPQRVVTGIEVPKDPETGQPLAAAEQKAAMSRLWTFKPADARVTSLPPADLANFVAAIEMFITHLAAQTRTPPHYLLGQVVNASGDALQVAEAGLVSKCKAKQLFYSDAWEEAMALALSSAGAETDQADCEALWANPERTQLGALVDAEVKKKSVGVPLPIIWAELGYTPEQIAEMTKEAEAAAEAELEARTLLEQATARLTIPAAPPAPGAAAVEPAQPAAGSPPPPPPPSGGTP